MEFWTWHSENLFVVFWQVPVSNPGRGEIRYMYVCCNVPMALPVSVSQRGSLSNSYEPWLSGKLSLKIQVGNAWQLCCVDISVLNIQGFFNYESCLVGLPVFGGNYQEVDHIVWSTFLILFVLRSLISKMDAGGNFKRFQSSGCLKKQVIYI